MGIENCKARLVAIASPWKLTNITASERGEVDVSADSAWPMTCVVFLTRHDSHELSGSRRADNAYTPPTLLISELIPPSPVPGNILTV